MAARNAAIFNLVDEHYLRRHGCNFDDLYADGSVVDRNAER